jgi:hypothetical protein
VVPPGQREVRMPAGTPFGLGFLGAARFSAIQRVLEHAERAARAKAAFHDARGAIADAIVREVGAVEQLNHLDTIREQTADRIRHAHAAQLRQEQAAIEAEEIAALGRKLKKIELEEEVRAKEARLKKSRDASESAERDAFARDEYAEFMEGLKKFPEIMQAAAEMKAQIIKSAGGEDKLTEAHKNMLDMIDAMMQSFMAKKASDSAG